MFLSFIDDLLGHCFISDTLRCRLSNMVIQMALFNQIRSIDWVDSPFCIMATGQIFTSLKYHHDIY